MSKGSVRHDWYVGGGECWWDFSRRVAAPPIRLSSSGHSMAVITKRNAGPFELVNPIRVGVMLDALSNA